MNEATWDELQNPQNYELILSVDSVYYLTDELSRAQFRRLRPHAEIMAYYSTYEPTPATHSVMSVDEVVSAEGIVSNPCGQLAPYRHPNVRLETPGAIKHFTNGYRHFELHRCAARDFNIRLVESLDLSRPVANPGTYWAQLEVDQIADPSVTPLVRELRARATMLSYDEPYAIEGLEAIVPILTTLRYRATDDPGFWYNTAWVTLFGLFTEAYIESSDSLLPLGLVILGCAPFNLPRVNRSACLVWALALWTMPITGITGIYFARCAFLSYLPGWVSALFGRETQFATAIAGYQGNRFDLARQVEPIGLSGLFDSILGASSVRLERLRDGYCYGTGGLRTLTWLPDYLTPFARLSDFIPEKIKSFSTNLAGVPVGNYLVSARHKPGSIQLNRRTTDTELNRSQLNALERLCNKYRESVHFSPKDDTYVPVDPASSPVTHVRPVRNTDQTVIQFDKRILQNIYAALRRQLGAPFDYVEAEMESFAAFAKRLWARREPQLLQAYAQSEPRNLCDYPERFKDDRNKYKNYLAAILKLI